MRLLVLITLFYIRHTDLKVWHTELRGIPCSVKPTVDADCTVGPRVFDDPFKVGSDDFVLLKRLLVISGHIKQNNKGFGRVLVEPKGWWF